MSWLYSQVLVEEFLGENFLDGEQSAPLNGNPTQQAYCAPDKMMDFSRLSRFGMTFAPLTANLGAELLMSYLEDFHAKTFQQREKVQELMESEAGCGEKWRGSFVKYDPDSSLWRTHQCSLLGGLDEFLETWPQWGLMRDGECWEQQMLVQTIRGTESGLSPNGVDSFHTPNTTGLDGGSNSRKTLKKRQMIPTPTSSMMPCEGTVRIMRKAWESGEFTLEEASAIAGRDVKKAQGKVPAWPTPNARDWKDSDKSGNRKAPGLGVMVHWPTPRTAGMCGGTGSWDLLKKNTTIEEARAMGAGNGGKLNPMWVEWLMGWPLGWTDLKPLEMDKSHFVPQPHGEL